MAFEISKGRWILIASLLWNAHFSRAVEPVSGYIITSEYAVKDGIAVGQKRSKRIWFRGSDVRVESLVGDEVTEVSVGGENSWSASPSAVRIMFENQAREPVDKTPLPAYPVIVRRNFARVFGNRAPVGKEEIKGLPCWKFAWHEEEVELGDVKSQAQDVMYWVYADEDFPLVLERQSSTGGKQELVEFSLNKPVGSELFLQPKDWPVARGFQLPKRKFVIEFQEERESAQYGWKLNSSDVFEGDGNKVTRTFRQTTTQQEKVSHFTPPVETLTYEQARDAIWNRVQTPEWFRVKKTAQETLLTLKVDVLENIIDGLVPEKFFVADHPLLGTVCLKRVTKMPTDVSTRSIARLEFPQ